MTCHPAIAASDDYSISGEGSASMHLVDHGCQLLSRTNRGTKDHVGVDRYCLIAWGVGRETEGTVGQGEERSTMHSPMEVGHRRGHPHTKRDGANSDLHQPDSHGLGVLVRLK